MSSAVIPVTSHFGGARGGRDGRYGWGGGCSGGSGSDREGRGGARERERERERALLGRKREGVVTNWG